MTMKVIKRLAAQGDLIVRRVDKLPERVEAQDVPAQGIIVAHSETGHHHIATGANAHYTIPDNVLVSFIVAKQDVEIKHHRSWDTHESLKLLADQDGGEVIWEIRRQREYTPEGWRRVED